MKRIIFFCIILIISCKKDKIKPIENDPISSIFIEQVEWKENLSTIYIKSSLDDSISYQYFYGKNGIPNGAIIHNYKDNLIDSFVIEIKDTIVFSTLLDPMPPINETRCLAIIWNHVDNIRLNNNLKENYVHIVAPNDFIYQSNSTILGLNSFSNYDFNFNTKSADNIFLQAKLAHGISYLASFQIQQPVMNYKLFIFVTDLRKKDDLDIGYDVITTHSTNNNTFGFNYNYLEFDYSADFIPYALFGVKVPNEYLIQETKSAVFDSKSIYEYKFNNKNQLIQINGDKLSSVSLNNYSVYLTYY